MGNGSIFAGIAAAIVAAEGVVAAVKGGSDLLRPPGSQCEKDFMARCIKCGKCIEACPYAVLEPARGAGTASGTPTINARTGACRLCEDFPCIAVCPTEALRNVESIDDVDMGYAKIDENLCIAFEGMRCEVCYRVCPLIDEAITIDFSSRDNDSIHARFIPVINKDACVGCGLCVERCVVDTPRVAIEIVSIAEQGSEAKKRKRVEKSTTNSSSKGNANGKGNGNGNGNGKEGTSESEDDSQ